MVETVVATLGATAVGAAAAFVPFPSAVDDHQTFNARFLVDQGGGWLLPQATLTPEVLADMLLKTERSALMQRALDENSVVVAQMTPFFD